MRTASVPVRESQTALAGFVLYYQLGDGRSIRRLHAELTARSGELGLASVPGRRTLFRWSSAHHWQERIEEIEQEAKKRVREELAEQQTGVYDRRAKLGLSLQQQGLQVLRAREFRDWSVSDALRAVERGSAMEAEAAGLGSGGDDDSPLARIARNLEEMTDEDLERLRP